MSSRTFTRRECDICGRVVASDEAEGWTSVRGQIAIGPTGSGVAHWSELKPQDICSAPCYAAYAVRIRELLLTHVNAPKPRTLLPATDNLDDDDDLPF